MYKSLGFIPSTEKPQQNNSFVFWYCAVKPYKYLLSVPVAFMDSIMISAQTIVLSEDGLRLPCQSLWVLSVSCYCTETELLLWHSMEVTSLHNLPFSSLRKKATSHSPSMMMLATGFCSSFYQVEEFLLYS
jgi:hypothetical protein